MQHLYKLDIYVSTFLFNILDMPRATKFCTIPQLHCTIGRVIRNRFAQQLDRQQIIQPLLAKGGPVFGFYQLKLGEPALNLSRRGWQGED